MLEKMVNCLNDRIMLNTVELSKDKRKDSGTQQNPDDKRLFKAPFSFKGRIRRMEYGVSYILFVFVYGLFTLIAKSEDPFLLLLATGLIIIGYWFILAQGAKRCHDLGHNGFWQIIPFYFLWLIFSKGDVNNNKYGNSPK